MVNSGETHRNHQFFDIISMVHWSPEWSLISESMTRLIVESHRNHVEKRLKNTPQLLETCTIGRAQAPVVPLPVSARPMMSRPCRCWKLATKRLGIFCLVVKSLLWKIWLSQWLWNLKKKGKNVKNVPNHQPDMDNRENLMILGKICIFYAEIRWNLRRCLGKIPEIPFLWFQASVATWGHYNLPRDVYSIVSPHFHGLWIKKNWCNTATFMG